MGSVSGRASLIAGIELEVTSSLHKNVVTKFNEDTGVPYQVEKEVVLIAVKIPQIDKEYRFCGKTGFDDYEKNNRYAGRRYWEKDQISGLMSEFYNYFDIDEDFIFENEGFGWTIGSKICVAYNPDFSHADTDKVITSYDIAEKLQKASEKLSKLFGGKISAQILLKCRLFY